MAGNSKNFTKIDVLRCFLRFDKNVSRHDLSKELGLGEGTVRTILDILKSKKLIRSTKIGHFLSKKGTNTLSQLYEIISLPKQISLKNIYPEYSKIGISVKNAVGLRQLYKLRDLAVKNGAEGALILKFDGRLYAPESAYEQNFDDIKKYFNLKEDDVVLVAFSNNKRSAENGALAIAAELNPFLKKFINKF